MTTVTSEPKVITLSPNEIWEATVYYWWKQLYAASLSFLCGLLSLVKECFIPLLSSNTPRTHSRAHARHERRRIQLKSKVIILRWWQHCLKMTLDFNVVQVNFRVWKDLWEDNAGPIYTQLKCVFPFESAPIPSWLNEQPVLNVACCAERISVAMLQSHSETGGQTKWPSESWLFCKGESIKMIFRFTKQRRIIIPLAVQRFRLFFARCNVCLTAL